MVKQSSKKVQKQNKVDFEPNKMTVAVASTAVVVLMLLALIIVIG